jgi:CPA2 family monovalent cation:H+ antiporter-2
LVIITVIVAVFHKRIHLFYTRVENRFLENYHDRENQQKVKERHELAPWDAIISQFTIPLGSSVTGIPLLQLSLREKYGVNIAMIKRSNDFIIMTPERDEKMYPGDVIFAIGTEEQLQHFKHEIETTQEENEATQEENIILTKLIIGENSPFINKNIRESDIRKKTNGIVVGVEKGSSRILNPESNYVFTAGDKVWIVGDKKRIITLKASLK